MTDYILHGGVKGSQRMEAVACAYWPTALPLLQRLAFPSYIGFGVCLAPKSTLPKPLLVLRFFPSEITPLTHRAANGENVGMSKGIVEETMYLFLFRCEKCNRPIIYWMLSPRHGGYSLEKAQTKALPLTCVIKECGWSEARFGRDAIESWAFPWPYATTGPFDQS